MEQATVNHGATRSIRTELERSPESTPPPHPTATGDTTEKGWLSWGRRARIHKEVIATPGAKMRTVIQMTALALCFVTTGCVSSSPSGFPRLESAPYEVVSFPSLKPTVPEALPPFVKAFLEYNELVTVPVTEFADAVLEELVYALSDGGAHYSQSTKEAMAFTPPSTWSGTPNPAFPKVNIVTNAIPPLTLDVLCAQQCGAVIGITYGGNLTIGVPEGATYKFPESRQPWVVLLPRETAKR